MPPYSYSVRGTVSIPLSTPLTRPVPHLLAAGLAVHGNRETTNSHRAGADAAIHSLSLALVLSLTAAPSVAAQAASLRRPAPTPAEGMPPPPSTLPARRLLARLCAGKFLFFCKFRF